MSDDDLCRPLNTGEQQWLAQSAPALICLIVHLDATATAAAAWTHEAAEAAVAAARARQPFLQVCVDADALRFKLAPPTPVSFEALEGSGDEAVRGAARRQLDLGVDRGATFARLHVVTTGGEGGATHLVLLGDHLALDARSLAIWAQAMVQHVAPSSSAAAAATAAAAAAAGGAQGSDGAPDGTPARLPFVDWTTRIPPVSLPPFAAPASAMLTCSAVAPEDLAAASPVEGTVSVLGPGVFASLKQATKARGLTLNGPLMASFLLAVGDVSRDQKQAAAAAEVAEAGEATAGDGAEVGTATVTVRTVCAVDLRGHLSPPLEADYMNNSASVVPAHATFSLQGGEGGEGGGDAGSSGDLWAVAAGLKEQLKADIASGEGFRLHDITTRMAFAEFGPIFAIPCLWSNVGHVGGGSDLLAGAEVLITGAGTNPILTGHCAEAGGRCALTVTVAPAFHQPATAAAVAARFAHHAAALAASSDKPCPCA